MDPSKEHLSPPLHTPLNKARSHSHCTPLPVVIEWAVLVETHYNSSVVVVR